MVVMAEQISGEAVGEVMIVSDMHERKAEMAHRADAFIALPGKSKNMHDQKYTYIHICIT